jgi:hypothetical protein
LSVIITEMRNGFILTIKQKDMKTITHLRYKNNELIKIGDKVKVVYVGNYAGGGYFQYECQGIVKGENDYAGLCVGIENWEKYYDCSQRLGSTPYPQNITVDSRYDYQKREYILDGRVEKLNDKIL